MAPPPSALSSFAPPPPRTLAQRQPDPQSVDVMQIIDGIASEVEKRYSPQNGCAWVIIFGLSVAACCLCIAFCFLSRRMRRRGSLQGARTEPELTDVALRVRNLPTQVRATPPQLRPSSRPFGLRLLVCV